MHRKSTTPPASSFTSDFPGGPYRVAYDRESREYVVVEVETGAELGWFAGTPAGYQDAYRAAAGHNTDAAALALEARAMLLDEQADRDAEAELDAREAALAARCDCFALGIEQPACLARGTSCDRAALKGGA